MAQGSGNCILKSLSQLAHAGGAIGTRGSKVKLYFEGDSVFRAMREAVDSAERYVHLEMYMFLSDVVGWMFAKVLCDKAKEGVSVRVVYDAIGSSEAESELFAMMKSAGVEVRVFRPVAPWRKRSGILGRNHRKNLIVDGRIAFTGGMNIGSVWSRAASGDRAWRDTHMSLEGPAAAACDEFFLESWGKVGGGPLQLDRQYEVGEEGEWESECLVVGGSGFARRKAIRKLYSTALRGAKSRLELTVPYFLPPRRLLNCLKGAADDGEVGLMVPKESDVRLADWLREGLYSSLLRKKVKIYEYTEAVLHAKSMVVDDDIAVVGSANFDFLSFSLNWELAVVIRDPEVVECLRRQYHKDLKFCVAVEDGWARSRPWWRKGLGWLGASILRKL